MSSSLHSSPVPTRHLQKLVSRAVDLLRDDGAKYRSALDAASASAAYDPSLIDWSALLVLVLNAATGGADGGGKRARTAGPTAELWQQLHFLFEQSERSGRHLTRPLVDACVEEAMALLHSDHRAGGSGGAGAGAGAASSASADRDPLRIQGAIASLAAILECVLGYAPYAQCIKQEHLHGQGGQTLECALMVWHGCRLATGAPFFHCCDISLTAAPLSTAALCPLSLVQICLHCSLTRC